MIDLKKYLENKTNGDVKDPDDESGTKILGNRTKLIETARNAIKEHLRYQLKTALESFHEDNLSGEPN